MKREVLKVLERDGKLHLSIEGNTSMLEVYESLVLSLGELTGMILEEYDKSDRLAKAEEIKDVINESVNICLSERGILCI